MAPVKCPCSSAAFVQPPAPLRPSWRLTHANTRKRHVYRRCHALIRKDAGANGADARKSTDGGLIGAAPCSLAPCWFLLNNNTTHDSFIERKNTCNSPPLKREKYSHLRLGIKATFHSGAFFKTLNYSLLEEGCDGAQALTGCFHVWLRPISQTTPPTNQSASPPGQAEKHPEPINRSN